MNCPMCMTSRSFAAVGVRVTPRMASHALAEARWWLTGQIPQMRGVITGISRKSRPFEKTSNPRYWVTWKRTLSTAPSSVRSTVIFPWPSMRVTGFTTMVFFFVFSMTRFLR